MAATSRRNHDLNRKSFERGDWFGLDFYFAKGIDTFNIYGSNPLDDYDTQYQQMQQLIKEQNNAQQD